MPKNVCAASKSRYQTEINSEITKLMTFIEQTMETLLVCYKQLKTFLNTDQTHFQIF